MLTVKIGAVPGTIQEVGLEEGATVADALSAANLSSTGWSITRNSVAVDQGASLNDGDRVMLTKAVKGN